ncbi:MAG: peptidoglycan-associated lipoprotein [Burkholderiaceae bacterium]|jgi:peptidoglycan-associated lipoprotein|nr:OmpA family protein [Burkholderiales bacterium]TAL70983.1 MAG: peptidoglycan-associated lipoprotein [Burkholderiaceae bacterium]TBR75880.1 MAG: peptidoglycan-associated lipoprotein [Burkholderiaceae bacterium]
MMKRMLLAFAVVALMAGCSSGVNLHKAPVDNQSGSMSTQGATSAVAPVNANSSDQNAAGPAGSHVVYFDFDKYIVKPEYQGVIESNADFLKANKARHAVIEGNTDDVGSAEYNLALGQRRSEAVLKALELLGVGDSQLEAISYGKEKPVALGDDPASRAKNRRAVIDYR